MNWCPDQQQPYKQSYLVKRPSEVSIKEISINNSFSNNTSHKSEVSLVIWIDTRIWVGLEGAAVLGRHEKSVVRIEHVLREDSKELSGQSACINALFTYKCNVKSTT